MNIDSSRIAANQSLKNISITPQHRPELQNGRPFKPLRPLVGPKLTNARIEEIIRVRHRSQPSNRPSLIVRKKRKIALGAQPYLQPKDNFSKMATDIRVKNRSISYLPHPSQVSELNNFKVKWGGLEVENKIKISRSFKAPHILEKPQNKFILEDILSIKEKIGKGSFASVYRAILRRNNRQVAVKILPKNSFKKRNRQVLVENEVECLKTIHRLQAGNNIACGCIVIPEELHQDNSNIYMIMEYCGGMTLNKMITKV